MTEYKIADGKEVRVAVSGKSGCGNTTVSSLLASRLKIKLINFTFRQLAEEKGMTLEQVILNARTDDSYDREVDTRQVALAKRESCVLGSRLAIWMLDNADLKAYLLADEDVRARRILNREGGDFEKIKAFTQMRDAEDTARYKKLYGIDNSRYEDTAELVIDTGALTPEQITDRILTALANKGLIQEAD
ncbi:MAG: (d)CMP kinase [Treponema sp.]